MIQELMAVKYLYVSNTVGDLTNGSLYMMKEKDEYQRKIW
jgi:HJR/Mrr/RecB family endonuclease